MLFKNELGLKADDRKRLINAVDIYNISPLILALKNNKNGSIGRLHKHGAILRQSGDDCSDISEIGIDLMRAAKSGDYECFVKYSKAGFVEFSKIGNMEGKSLAHIVRFINFR